MAKTELTEWAKGAMARRPAERILARKVLKVLKDAGDPVVEVYYGETEKVADTNAALNLIFNLDECWLITKSGRQVFLVMGQDWDMLTDYSVSLEEILKPVEERADKGRGW